MKTYIVEKIISIDAPISKVFEALTDSKQIVQYYPLEEVISDWQVGCEIVAKGSIEGQNFTDYGIIDSLIQDREFQYTYWSTNHGTQRTPENYLTINYQLLETEKGTRLRLTQSKIKSEQMQTQMQSIWDFLLSNLKNFVESQ